MKRIFLSLLTPIAIGGICFSAFAQIDTSKKINPGNSDKWEIIKENTKSSTGKLFVTLPKGTEWDMTIYAAGTTKVLSSTSLKTSFTLQPGTYDLEINKIRITGVPVEKGNNTRLKAGVLHMTTIDSWTLYDEPKKIVLINSLSPQERGLPIGNYKLTLLGQVQDIEIKDEGTTAEDSIKEERVPQERPVLEGDDYVMTPINENIGRLITFISTPFTMGYTINYALYVIKDGKDVFYCRESEPGNSCNLDPVVLDEGDYTISYYIRSQSAEVSSSPIWLNVPIRKGYETRLKVGYLSHTPGNFKVFDESGQNEYMSYLRQSDAGLPIPVGKYLVKQKYVGDYHVEVKDGKTELLNPFLNLELNIASKIIIAPVRDGKPLKPGMGRLNCRFPLADTTIFRINIPKTGGGFSTVRLDALSFIDLKPGNYEVRLACSKFSIPIQAGKQTTIPVGYLKSSMDRPQFVQEATGPNTWGSVIEAFYSQKTMPLLIGFYLIRIDNGAGITKRHLVKIENSEIDNF